MTLISKIWKKLRNPTYRHGFTVAQAKQGIAFQVKALRKQQQLSQVQLAELAHIDQSSISRAENPEYGDLALNTLLAIAEGFDVALVCEFVPFSELVDRSDRLPHRSVHIPTFKEEDEATSEGAASGTSPQLVPPPRALAENIPTRARKVPHRAKARDSRALRIA